MNRLVSPESSENGPKLRHGYYLPSLRCRPGPDRITTLLAHHLLFVGAARGVVNTAMPPASRCHLPETTVPPQSSEPTGLEACHALEPAGGMPRPGARRRALISCCCVLVCALPPIRCLQEVFLRVPMHEIGWALHYTEDTDQQILVIETGSPKTGKFKYYLYQCGNEAQAVHICTNISEAFQLVHSKAILENL